MGLVCLIILALCGIGINGAGPVLSQSKERYPENNVKIELVQVKEKDDDSTESIGVKL